MKPDGIQLGLTLLMVAGIVVAANLLVRDPASPLGWAVAVAAAVALWVWIWRLRKQRVALRATNDRVYSLFVERQSLFMIGFVLTLLLAMYQAGDAGSTAMRVALAALPAIMLASWAWAFAAMIRGADEMLQILHLKAVAASAGIVLTTATLWGLAGAILPELAALPVFLLLPAFAVIYAIVYQFLGGNE